MAEAVFPFFVYPAEGQLPFINTAKLTKGNALIALHVPISVWPAPNGATNVGVVYDHGGETGLDYFDLFRTPNVKVTIDDLSYMVVDIQKNLYVPHAALMLRESNAML
jgi:hypothetical protein